MSGHSRMSDRAHLVLLQHHEVEMPDTFFCVVAHAFLEGDRVDDVTDVLVDEGVSGWKCYNR